MEKRARWERFFESSVGDFFSRLRRSPTQVGMTFNILITEADGTLTAHCLELDIVTTADTVAQAQRDIVSLICAQLDYAFTHNNLGHLYRPAPPEAWEKFFACNEPLERRYPVYGVFKKQALSNSFVPPFLIAKTCHIPSACHV